MLIARDGGCTKPSCTTGAYGSQAHHTVTDWARGGTPDPANHDPTTSPADQNPPQPEALAAAVNGSTGR